MGKGKNTSPMRTPTMATMLMGFPRDWASIPGLMEVDTRGISGRDSDAGLESGRQRIGSRNTWVSFRWTRKMGMGN